MAHAHAELTGGLGVAMVTAGPGVTNCVTAMANASIARVPVLLIGGCPPRPQVNMGPLQDIPHVDILRPLTRAARTARVAEQVLRELDELVARAEGDAGEPGPVYFEIPTDVLRETVPPRLILEEHLRAKPRRVLLPDPSLTRAACEALWSAKKPLVLTGRGAREAGPAITRLLDKSGAVYLDTQESRGLVANDHRSVVGAMRGRVMQEADLVLAIGRKFDYQVGYGSPAIFRHARFIRVADNPGELIDNRRADVEILANPSLTLEAILEHAGNRKSAADRAWTAEMRKQHEARTQKYADELVKAPPGRDGKMHPNRIFAAILEVFPRDAIAIADGGDILSFARLGLSASTYMDSGAFGCLGVGVPFAIAAALAFPGRAVISVSGDGAFGINAMEIDTAVRHGAKCVFVVANNAAWNIERYDQEANYGGRVVGTTLRYSDYAGMARALGAHGERVEDPAKLKDALKRALENAPALVDVVLTQDAVSSDAKKGLGFVPDYQALTDWDEAERKRRSE